MSKSLSERGLRVGLGLSLSGLALAAVIFYGAQNSGSLPGGRIAPVKLAWLACAILFWYLLPALLLTDRRLSQAGRFVVSVLLANMIARAVIELALMYVTGGWHPWMGIGHDLFSLLVLLALVTHFWGEMEGFCRSYLLVAAIMFIPEGIFAWYMLNNVGVAGETVYFVPDEAVHQPIMLATAICVALLIVYLGVFSRRWLYAPSEG